MAEKVKKYDADKQNKFRKSKYLDAVFALLGRFGFAMEGADAPDSVKITVGYPEKPAVLTALHGFAQAKICRISFGFDFAKFNYRVFAH